MRRTIAFLIEMPLRRWISVGQLSGVGCRIEPVSHSEGGVWMPSGDVYGVFIAIGLRNLSPGIDCVAVGYGNHRTRLRNYHPLTRGGREGEAPDYPRRFT